MNRSFFLNLVFLIAINVLIKPFYLFGIDRVVQNTVEDGAYGLYAVFFNWAYIFVIINDLGIYNFNNKTIAQHQHLLDKYFSNILVLKLLLSIPYLLLLVVVIKLSGYEWNQFQLLLPIAINQLLVSLIMYLRSNISSLGYYTLNSVFSVLDKVLMILICVPLLWISSFSEVFRIEWFIWAQTISLAVTALGAFLWTFRKVRYFKLKVNISFLLVIARQSYPYALIVLLMNVYTRTDAIMIERLIANGKVEVEYYVSAFRLFDVANMFGLLFASLLLPMFSTLIKNSLKELTELYHLGLQIIIAGTCVGVIAIIFNRQIIMEVLYDNGGYYSGNILGLLMIGFMAVSITHITGTLLMAAEQIKPLNRIFFTAVFLNIGLNFILIPKYESIGAALTTLITQCFIGVMEIYLVSKYVGIKISNKIIFKVVVLILSMVSIGALLGQLSIPWMLNFTALILLGMILSFILRLVNIPQLLQLVRQKE
ncbi:MAG: polysaccharide biosynthesis C-terminal domain-containing protein [Bacteroidota bacterium]